MEKIWFLQLDGNQIGPLADIAVKVLYESGRINNGTPVWRTGMGEWQSLGRVDEITSFLTHVEYIDSLPPPIPHDNNVPEIIWYVVIGNEQQGPHSSSEVYHMLKEKKIHSSTLVWRKGLAEWTQIFKVAEFSNLEAVPPPIPGAIKNAKVPHQNITVISSDNTNETKRIVNDELHNATSIIIDHAFNGAAYILDKAKRAKQYYDKHAPGVKNKIRTNVDDARITLSGKASEAKEKILKNQNTGQTVKAKLAKLVESLIKLLIKMRSFPGWAIRYFKNSSPLFKVAIISGILIPAVIAIGTVYYLKAGNAPQTFFKGNINNAYKHVNTKKDFDAHNKSNKLSNKIEVYDVDQNVFVGQAAFCADAQCNRSISLNNNGEISENNNITITDLYFHNNNKNSDQPLNNIRTFCSIVRSSLSSSNILAYQCIGHNWNIFIYNVDTGDERFVCDNCTHPVWSNDGKYLIYTKNNRDIEEFDMELKAREIMNGTYNFDGSDVVLCRIDENYQGYSYHKQIRWDEVKGTSICTPNNSTVIFRNTGIPATYKFAFKFSRFFEPMMSNGASIGKLLIPYIISSNNDYVYINTASARVDQSKIDYLYIDAYYVDINKGNRSLICNQCAIMGVSDVGSQAVIAKPLFDKFAESVYKNQIPQYDAYIYNPSSDEILNAGRIHFPFKLFTDLKIEKGHVPSPGQLARSYLAELQQFWCKTITENVDRDLEVAKIEMSTDVLANSVEVQNKYFGAYGQMYVPVNIELANIIAMQASEKSKDKYSELIRKYLDTMDYRTKIIKEDIGSNLSRDAFTEIEIIWNNPDKQIIPTHDEFKMTMKFYLLYEKDRWYIHHFDIIDSNIQDAMESMFWSGQFQ